MKLIVALNNPGKRYINTPHNIAVEALLLFMKDHNISFDDFHLDNKFQALYYKGQFYNETMILALPKTYMNLSGEAVKKLKDYYNIDIEDIIVLQDEIDLPAGQVKINKNRGSAGHNGIKNIIGLLKDKNFIRIRIGVKTNLAEKMPKDKFVLHKLNQEERKEIDKSVELAKEALVLILKEGFEKAQSIINAKN